MPAVPFWGSHLAFDDNTLCFLVRIILWTGCRRHRSAVIPVGEPLNTCILRFCWFCKLSFERVSNLSKELIINTCTGSCEPSLWLNTLMLFFLYCLQLYTLQPSLSYQEQLSRAAPTSTETHWARKHRRIVGILEPSPLYCAAFGTKCKMYILYEAYYLGLRERAKWWWSILAEAIMKHWVFPGSQWDVLLGNIPRDRGWRTGLMRKQSSQPHMEITKKCPIAEYWSQTVN